MVRTGISGVVATALDVAVLVMLIELADAPIALAAFLGAASGATANFLVSKFWAFRCPRPIDLKQLSTYAVVSLTTAVFMAASLHVLAVIFGVPYIVAKAIAAAAVFLMWSYPAQSRLVFRSAPVITRRAAP